MNLQVNNEQLKFYKDNGYLIVKGIIDRESINKFFLSLKLSLQKYKKLDSSITFTGWHDPSLTKEMISLRKENPLLFGAMFDEIQTAATLQAILGDMNIIETAAQLLEESSSSISVTGKMSRMDPPLDERNSLDWHQESAYYNQNLDGNDGLVCWIPMHEMNEKNGSVMICPGSHKEGNLKAQDTGREDYITSQQFKINKIHLRKYQQLRINATIRDAVFFNQNIFHRSGINSSENIRFSVNARYHKMSPIDFLPGRLVYKPNEYILQKRNEKNIS